MQQKNKNYLKKIDHHLFNNLSLESNSLSEIDNIIQEEEDTVLFPEVSKLIDSVISKRQEDRRKKY